MKKRQPLDIDDMKMITDDTLRIARSIEHHMSTGKRMADDTADNLRGMLESIIHKLQNQ